MCINHARAVTIGYNPVLTFTAVHVAMKMTTSSRAAPFMIMADFLPERVLLVAWTLLAVTIWQAYFGTRPSAENLPPSLYDHVQHDIGSGTVLPRMGRVPAVGARTIPPSRAGVASSGRKIAATEVP